MPFGACVMTSDQKHCSDMQKAIEARNSENDEAGAFVSDDFRASTEALVRFTFTDCSSVP